MTNSGSHSAEWSEPCQVERIKYVDSSTIKVCFIILT